MPKTLANFSTLLDPVALVGEMIIGPLYDTVGRKPPVVFALVLGAIAELIIAFS